MYRSVRLPQGKGRRTQDKDRSLLRPVGQVAGRLCFPFFKKSGFRAQATVRSFLDTLESFGQLERTKLPKSMVITMHLHDGSHAVPDIVQGTAGIVRQLNGILSEWINGSITSDDAGIACGQIVHQSITDAGLKYELPEDDCSVTLQKLPERMNARERKGHRPRRRPSAAP